MVDKSIKMVENGGIVMSKFSEYLEKGIDNSGMTENQLAKISGFTRSYIALMKNGQRVSRDMEKTKCLLQALNLSVEEYNAIWSEYLQERMGKERYQKTDAVMKFMQNFDCVSNLRMKAVVQYDIPKRMMLKGSMDIEYMIRAMIEKEAAKENGFIYIMMQPKASIWDSLLPGICKNNKNLLIEHIVCMEKFTDIGMKNKYLYNFDLLKKLVPTVVCNSSDNYKVYYFYDHIASRAHSGWLLSNMVLTSEHLLCFDPAMDNAVLTDEQAMYDMFKNMFEEHKKNCHVMFQHMDMMQCMQYGIYMKNARSRNCYTIATQPCFAMLKVVHMLKRYLKPEYVAIGPLLEAQINANLEWLSEEKNKEISYCNKSGLLRFAQDGIVDEMPYGTYDLLNKADRKRMLELLVEQIETGKYEMYLIDDMDVKLLPELTICSFSASNSVIRYQSPNHSSQIMLQEKSSDKIIYEALEVAMKHPHVLSMEESLEFLKNIIVSL